MLPRPLLPWSPEEASRFGRGVLLGKHNLSDLELFSDAGLIELIETHPRHRFFVHTMGSDLAKPKEWRTGDPGALSGADILKAVHKGRLWLNILEVESHHAAYRELIDGLYDEIEALVPGFRTTHRSANVLVSSPRAMVYYHADAPPNVLWHLRGRKRVWVYPAHDPRFASQENLEKIFSREMNEDLPYDPSFDAHAQIFDLEPGQVLTWPQNGPHRVENLEGLNVSISSEYFTVESKRRERVFSANRLLRGRLGLPARSTGISGPVAAAKSFLYRAVKKSGLFKGKHYRFDNTFRLDPEAETGMIDTAP